MSRRIQDVERALQVHVDRCLALQAFARRHGTWDDGRPYEPDVLDEGALLQRQAHQRLELDHGAYALHVVMDPRYLAFLIRGAGDRLAALPYVLRLPFSTVMPPAQPPGRHDPSDEVLADREFLQTLMMTHEARETAIAVVRRNAAAIRAAVSPPASPDSA